MNRGRRRNLIRASIVLGVLAAGVAVAVVLVVTRPAPDEIPRDDRGTLVEVVQVERRDHPLELRLQGEVQPARRVVVQPQISGRVVEVSPNLVPGGRVGAGETLLRVDDRDYRLALDSARAQVHQREVELRQEQSRRRVAQEEWALLGEPPPDDDSLAMRGPQLQSARQALEAARSQLEQARLELQRTVVEAPFDAFVQQEAVDVGQLVSPQTDVAVLVGVERFRVITSLPVARLGWVRVPGVNAPAGGGSLALVRQQVGDGQILRTGRVAQLLGDLDPQGRMARLLVEVQDPLGLEPETQLLEGNTSQLPLLLNAYADVEIDAGTLPGVIAVPRGALRNGDAVYVMNDEGRLEMRQVEVAWRGPADVLVRTGVRSGELVVTSRLPGAVEGMRLRAATPAGQQRPEPQAPGESNGAGPGESNGTGESDGSPGERP